MTDTFGEKADVLKWKFPCITNLRVEDLVFDIPRSTWWNLQPSQMDPGNIRRDGAQTIATYNGAESRSGWTKYSNCMKMTTSTLLWFYCSNALKWYAGKVDMKCMFNKQKAPQFSFKWLRKWLSPFCWSIWHWYFWRWL